MLTWWLFSLVLLAMVGGSFWNSLGIQRQTKACPLFKFIEIKYAQRQQRCSQFLVTMFVIFGAADYWSGHHGFSRAGIYLGLASTVGLIGGVYRWHEKMLRFIPDPPSEYRP